MSKEIHIELSFLEKKILSTLEQSYTDFAKFIEKRGVEKALLELGLLNEKEEFDYSYVKKIRDIFVKLNRDSSIYDEDISYLEKYIDATAIDIKNNGTTDIQELVEANILINIIQKINIVKNRKKDM